MVKRVTKNFADVIRGEIAADPELAAGVAEEHANVKLMLFLKEKFPEEVEGIDLENHTEVIDKAIELLERLWRWER